MRGISRTLLTSIKPHLHLQPGNPSEGIFVSDLGNLSSYLMSKNPSLSARNLL